ncbi:MAG: hypothetical protein ACTSYD_10560 [Candidatus Heimdallarchaeaceae archaeon]
MSGERYKIKFIIPNLGEAVGELERTRGPHLTEMLVRALPIQSRGLLRDGMFFIPVSVLYAIEKPFTSANRGDIVYEANSKGLMILLETKTFDNKIAKIGRITRNLELFEKIRRSAGVKIEKLI